MHYYSFMSDVTIDMRTQNTTFHASVAEPWRITLVDTGEETMTGERIKRIKDYVKDDEFFCLTYGDGLADVNIADSIAFHRKHGKLATVTAVQPAGRFGLLNMKGDRSLCPFQEKT